ncbi:MAG: DNA-processing protein DprA, partial [Microbacterium sp.]
VVVEAGWRSGSLNTAGHASSLGRPLGAVPGPVTSAASAGCHRLMREYDAQCVTNAAEVRELMGIEDRSPVTDESREDPERIRLLDALSTRTPRSPTEIARMAGLAEESTRSLLGMLSLEGSVARDDAGWRRAVG